MVTIENIKKAAEQIEPVIRSTPLIHSYGLSRRCGVPIQYKPESLQRGGSFKVRGAYHRILNLSDAEKTAGVVAASAGNHAQGVALAATWNRASSIIVMPEDTPLIKVERTRGYGGEVVLWGTSIEEAFDKAQAIGEERGLTFVHPFADPLVIAGQGTIGLEILAECPDIRTVLVPIGGGGLISGIGTALKAHDPKIRVIGLQAEGANAGVRSLREGKLVTVPHPETIADGIRNKRISEMTFEIMQKVVDDVVDVTEEEISQAIVYLLERGKLVVEAAGAVTTAALLASKVPRLEGPVCVVLSGGNIDTNLVARIIQRGLTTAHRFLIVRVPIPDVPGRLFGILEVLSGMRVNVLEIHHHRAGWEIPVGWTEVEIVMETRDREHGDEIVGKITAKGFEVSRGPRGSRQPA